MIPLHVVVPLLAVACGVVAFAAWFVLQERWIYFWDWSGYWRRTIELAARLRSEGWPSFFAEVNHSLRSDDYNVLPVLPLVPTTLALGAGRLAYVLSIVLLYGLPAAASVWLLACRVVLRPRGATPLALVAAGATTLVMPRLWMPVLAGLPDVIGCILIPLVWWTLRVPLAQLTRGRLVAIGVALAVLIVLRRWYAYWAVALLVAVVVEDLVASRGRELRATALRLGAVGAVALATLLALTGEHGVAMLRTDYGALYAAYRSADPLRTAALRLLRDFGPLWLALAACGLWLARRVPAARRLTRLLLLQSVVIVVLFTRTQDFGSQHYYLLIPQLALWAGVAAAALADLRATALRIAACTALAILLLADVATSFVPGARDALGRAALPLAGVSYTPLVRDDLAELTRLLRDLDALTRDGDEPVYVLSSSMTLNEGIVRDACLADATLPDLDARVVAASHVDARDGFPQGLAWARYVVVADPIGYHLDPAEQRAVGVPARMLLDGTSIGSAFERLPGEYVLTSGTRVLVFRRVRDLTPQELDALAAAIRAPTP